MDHAKSTDQTVYNLIKKEAQRQHDTLMLIPSENYASKAVEQAVGSCLGNKYAEGYPEKRYYQGQEFVDQIENLAIDRAKKLFGVPFANVQPLFRLTRKHCRIPRPLRTSRHHHGPNAISWWPSHTWTPKSHLLRQIFQLSAIPSHQGWAHRL